MDGRQPQVSPARTGAAPTTAAASPQDHPTRLPAPRRTFARGACLPWVLALALLAGCSSPEPPGAAPDAPLAMPIGQVQGRGATSPYLDQRVELNGVVTGNFVAGLGGFFMQDALGEEDGDPATADGIFVVWARGSHPNVRRGDRVQVAGMVIEAERGGSLQTAVRASAVEVLGRGAVRITDIHEAPSSVEEWEQLEGMWLRIHVPLTVTGNDGLLRFGELATSFGGRQFSPTQLHRPGKASRRVEADNLRQRLILDDNRNAEYPDSIWYLPEPLSRDAPLRVGSTVHGVEGILHHAFGWRLQLTEKIERIDQSERPPAPDLPEGTRIASFNVYNWFNGDGQGKGFPTPRGAGTVDEMNRQRDKLVAAILGLLPDVAALMEVENDGFGRHSSLAQLVTALNAAHDGAGYRLVDAGRGPGDDAMRVALIYREARVTALGEPAVLEDGAFRSLHRVPVAQAFRATGSDLVFAVVANHLKSKICRDAQGANADQGDGQACWNAARSTAARELDAWIATDPTGQAAVGTLLLGDLNSHSREDPLELLGKAGWRDALQLVGNQDSWSFNYRGLSGRLDHALLSPALVPRLRAALEWHINADESDAFDYRIRQRPDDWYAADPYRSSDHDPLILVLDLDES